MNICIWKTCKSLMDTRNQAWADMKGTPFLTRRSVTVDGIVLACRSENRLFLVRDSWFYSVSVGKFWNCRPPKIRLRPLGTSFSFE